MDFNESSSSLICELISDTTTMIDRVLTTVKPPFSKLFGRDDAVTFFNSLQSRAEMIEFMKSNNSLTDFHDLSEIARTMEVKILENIESSKWLHGDMISDYVREKIKDKVSCIQIYHDFDEHDKNMTYILKINNNFNYHLYFTNKRKTGIFALDTLLRIRYAKEELFKKANNTPEDIFVGRINDNFGFNAFFDGITKTVTMLAPLMLRNSFSSKILKEPFITYHVLGHELYHSLFGAGGPALDALNGHRGKCIMNHYQKSCSKFAIGACTSGRHTFNEDTPDVESNRLVYRILGDLYNDQQLNTVIDGLDTTLEQAYFYYVASSSCERDEVRSQELADLDPHSANNIRINAGFSLMPEFTKAFRCKEGDPMFIKKEESCYVFGPD
ncbi:hypothetical protein PMAYCL1PPCAC_05367, partial [Pristionchus mayeri]